MAFPIPPPIPAPAGSPYESVYFNMPPLGLGRAAGARLVPATGAMLTAYKRLASVGPGAEPPAGCPMGWPEELREQTRQAAY